MTSICESPCYYHIPIQKSPPPPSTKIVKCYKSNNENPTLCDDLNQTCIALSEVFALTYIANNSIRILHFELNNRRIKVGLSKFCCIFITPLIAMLVLFCRCQPLKIKSPFPSLFFLNRKSLTNDKTMIIQSVLEKIENYVGAWGNGEPQTWTPIMQ